jgi:AcrR family transcriptional regulator/DNA-binding MarR family transcriptional regulator
VAREVHTRAVKPMLAGSGRRPGAGGRRVVRIPSRASLPREQVAEIQHTRLLAAAVDAIEEHGYPDVTVAQITSRARVSRRTFYELFDSCEGCLAAVIEEILTLVGQELKAADLEGLGWLERVRGGLWVILCFLDREPALARLCVVQAARGGPWVLARREEILTRLAAVLDEGRQQGTRVGKCSPLTAEGLVSAALGILSARLARREQRPLAGLQGELMGMIVLPYLGAAAARREQARPAPTRLAAHPPSGPKRRLAVVHDPLRELPMRLTYRTARVLGSIAAQPGISNREVAEEAGIADQGQVSKLLARLQRLEIVQNTGAGHTKGEPNAWKLTPLGHEVAQRLHPRHAEALA